MRSADGSAVPPGRRSLGPAALVLAALLGASAAAWAEAPPGGTALDRLVDEMTRPPRAGRDRPMDLYARAFAGYALVDRGLDARAAAPRTAALDALIDRVIASRGLIEAFGTGTVVLDGQRLSRSVALRGHLALLLVGRHLLGAMPPPSAARLDALVNGLAADVLATKNHLLPTYGARTWPADNEVARAALALYLRRVKADETVARALAALSASLDALERSGLPPSEVRAGTLDGKDAPRGCALSWTAALRGLWDPAGAGRLYDRYRREFLVELGPIRGFREWPRGVDRKSDADSGPIVMGVGTAASGIALGAARLLGRADDLRALRRSASLAGLDGIERRRSGAWTARAMALWAETARAWVGE